VKKFLIGIPSELYRWLEGFMLLRGTDALIVPGTGLLTDAYGLLGWGRYNVLKWSVIARLCSCKLFFVSVGAGPIYSSAGRFFVKTALSLANFRSYRDDSTLQFLKAIGFRVHNDRVSPDLAFSLPTTVTLQDHSGKRRRLIVGLGLMEYAGRYSVANPTDAVYSAYLEALANFANWLLAHGYDIRLLIGDVGDTPVTQEFKSLLKAPSVMYEQGRIIDDPVASVQDLLSQLAATDFVVATRFHNILLSLLVNKPVIAISFHHKCSSLMSQMGLAEYCQDINDLKAQELIERFCQLEHNAGYLRRVIGENVRVCRETLDEQYDFIFREICPNREDPCVAIQQTRTPASHV